MVTDPGDWSSPSFEFPPVVLDTGPFPRRGFLEALWKHDPTGDLCLVESGSGLVPLAFNETGLHWVGQADLVDYRSPLGDGAPELLAEVLTRRSGLRFLFDSLPGEAANVVRQGLIKAGFDTQPEQHAVTARLHLPETYEAYLHQIGKKERHEIRRKRRRFHDVHGAAELVTTYGTGEGFAHFVQMHRNSPGAKGRFMTSSMEEFFASLACQAGWQVDLLCGADGRPAAATFSWADGDGFYLYNSAYDRTSEASPGIVLLSMLIERAVETTSHTFDFLKGDEPYKFRLGAAARPLYRFEGST